MTFTKAYTSEPKKMKNIKSILLIGAVVALTVVGCATKNPEHKAGDPSTPAYVTDPKLEKAHQAADTVVDSTAAINPYAVPTKLAVDGIFGLIAVVAGIFANSKSKKAAAAEATTNTMAAGVAKAGPQALATVMDHAADSSHFPQVAAALNKATPEGTSP